MAGADRPDGTEETIAAPISGAEPTLAAPVTGADATVMTTTPSSDLRGGSRARAASPSIPRSGASAATTMRKVGQEIVSASIQRFGSVGRDRFEVLDELARGGLGRVFRARDPRTGRILAIKEVLHPTPEILARFAREALVTANLQHPSIVPVYEVGTWDGGEPFYAMKLLAGRTLDRVIADATTTDARVTLVPHVIAIADALAYAHSEHVIHRDLKPSNVIVGSYGETIVIDWGLAKNLATEETDEVVSYNSAVAPAPQETVAGSVLGTPAYMPPEQARGERLDEHADVYAIGAILYHVLTGQRPFAEVTDLAALIERVATSSPRPIAELAPGAPAELVAIAEKAMARDARDRYPNAEGLAADLRSFQAGKLVGAHRYSLVQLARRWIARHAAAVTVAGTALIVLAVSGVIAVRRIASERDEAQHQGAIARDKQREAEAANGAAKRRLADTLEELGRQALVDALPERALPLLAASATTRDEQTTTVGVLAAQARAAYTGLVAIAPATHSATTGGGLAANGSLLLTADKDGHVTGWDIAARRTRWTVDAGFAIAVSPDGTQFLASALDGTLSLRAADTGQALATWPAGPHGGEPASVLVWARDGKHFAFAGTSGRIVIGTPGQAALVDADAHRGPVYAVAFSPDGTRIASGDAGGAITIHDARTGGTVGTLADAPRELAAIAWIDNDRLVDGDDRGTARLWQVGQRRALRRFELGRAIYTLAVADDGSWLAAAGDGETVKLWTLATGEPRADLAGHGLGVNVVATAGGWLVTGDELGVVRVWDPATGERLHSFPSEDEIITLDAHDGLVAAIARGRQRVWKLAPDAVVRRVAAHTARLRGLAFGADGTLYTASLDGTGRAIDITHGTSRPLGSADSFVELPSRTLAELAAHTRPNPHGARSITLSPDGRSAALALEDGRIELFDRAGAPLATWRGHTGRVRRVVFTRDGKTAYSVGDTTLRAWDVATGTERAKVALAGTGWDVMLIGGGTTLATLSENPTAVQLWRAADLAAVPHAPRESTVSELIAVGDRLLVGDKVTITLLDATGAARHEAPYSLAFSADATDAGGRARLAVGSSNGRIVLYDAATLTPLRDFQFGNQVITRVAFRPDGKLLAAISDRRVELFDPETGRLLAALPDLPVLLSQLAWSPDGRYVAIAGAGGTVWVWDVAAADARALAGFGACVSPWRLDDTTLVKKTFDPETCSVLAPTTR